MIAWNRQYGDMIDGEDSITSAWQTAMQAAQEYGDIVSALNGINNDIANEQQGILDQQQADCLPRMALTQSVVMTVCGM